MQYIVVFCKYTLQFLWLLLIFGKTVSSNSVSQVIGKDYNLNEQIHLFDNATNQRLSIGFAWFLMKGYMEVGGKYLMLHLCKT